MLDEKGTGSSDQDNLTLQYHAGTEFSKQRKIIIKNLPPVTYQEVKDFLEGCSVTDIAISKKLRQATVTLKNGEAEEIIKKFDKRKIFNTEVRVCLHPLNKLLCITNLPSTLEENEFREAMNKFGVIDKCFLMRHENTDDNNTFVTSARSKGYGFVEFMHNKQKMEESKQQINKTTIQEHKLKCHHVPDYLLKFEDLHSAMLYIENIPENADLEYVTANQEFCGIKVFTPKNGKKSALLQFICSRDAENAQFALSGSNIFTERPKVTFCAPGFTMTQLSDMLSEETKAVTVSQDMPVNTDSAILMQNLINQNVAGPANNADVNLADSLINHNTLGTTQEVQLLANTLLKIQQSQQLQQHISNATLPVIQPNKDICHQTVAIPHSASFNLRTGGGQYDVNIARHTVQNKQNLLATDISARNIEKYDVQQRETINSGIPVRISNFAELTSECQLLPKLTSQEMLASHYTARNSRFPSEGKRDLARVSSINSCNLVPLYMVPSLPLMNQNQQQQKVYLPNVSGSKMSAVPRAFDTQTKFTIGFDDRLVSLNHQLPVSSGKTDRIISDSIYNTHKSNTSVTDTSSEQLTRETCAVTNQEEENNSIHRKQPLSSHRQLVEELNPSTGVEHLFHPQSLPAKPLITVDRNTAKAPPKRKFAISEDGPGGKVQLIIANNNDENENPGNKKIITPIGKKRNYSSLLPPPEASPEGNYVGQHSQGFGGHYAESYIKRKRIL